MAKNVPADIGMPLDDIDTPALLIDLDAFERNVEKMADFTREAGIRLRCHAKTHKSADIAKYQISRGAVGVCCQKVSEAEALVDGGVADILVSNEVIGDNKVHRLAALARRARVLVCVDDPENISDLNRAAGSQGVVLEVLVEIDVGAGRCGVSPGQAAVPLAEKITRAPNLKFTGIQAYQGGAQHIHDYTERRKAIDRAIERAGDTVARITAAGLSCDTVTGAGTGSYRFEAGSGLYNELQCGSYIFMDAHYGRIDMDSGTGNAEFENSLFVYTSVMSNARPGIAVCDAGLKAHSVDSGMPVIVDRPGLEYTGASDEHGQISDPGDTLRLGDKLFLVPGHCDPTVNLYDWFAGVRNGVVEVLWPVSARGMCV